MAYKIPDHQILDALTALKQAKNNQTIAAKKLGINRTSFIRRLRAANERGLVTSDLDVEFPELPSSELPPEELIAQACARFESHRVARDARRWMELKIKSNQPIAVCFVGDPHVDDNGCNWPLLDTHIKVMRDTPGMFAVNIGDLTNNWVGRLIKLYADTEMSKKQAWKLAKYLLRDCGVKWLCHILGNHDLWNDGPFLIKANAAPIVPVEDWQSRFQLVFPNGTRVKVHVAHDFPGSSIWNKMHGPQKASMLNEEADIFACGHKHEWAINTSENAQRNFVYHLIRARGYKFIDSYADQLGYGSQRYGATITAVIDPREEGVKRINCFADIEEAAAFLNWKKSK